MYNVHQDAKLLPVGITTTDYINGSDKLPAVSASASRDESGKTHISLVNIDPKKAQTITVNIEGARFATVTGRILTSSKLQNYNSFDEPDKIKPATFDGAELKANKLIVKLPPFSVVILELK